MSTPTHQYIQLNQNIIDNAATPDLVFPCLTWDGAGGGTAVYRWALLVAEDNELLKILIAALGFKKDDRNPSGEVPVGWLFYYLADGAPIKPLKKGDASDPAALEFYLDVQLPAAADKLLIRPTSINVRHHEVDKNLGEAKEVFFGIEASPKEKDWSVVFANGSDSNRPCTPSFTFPLQPRTGFTIGSTTVSFPSIEVTLSLQANQFGTSGGVTTWRGGQLKAGQFVVQADAQARRYDLGGGLFFNVDAEKELSLERNLDQRLSFTFLPPEAIVIALPRQRLRIRFGASQMAILLQPKEDGVPNGVILEMSSHIIMSADGLARNVLPQLMPAKRTDGEDRALKFTTIFELPASWNTDENALFSTHGTGVDQRLGVDDALSRLAHEHEIEVHVNSDGGVARFMGLDFDLSSLFGRENPLATFSLGPWFGNKWMKCTLDRVIVPLTLQATICARKLSLELFLGLDLTTLRLSDNKIHFRFPKPVEDHFVQWIDLPAFAIGFPNRLNANESDDSTAISGDNDGYLDLGARELVITSPVRLGKEYLNPIIVFPGDITNDDPNNRVILELEPFDPERWPERGQNNIVFRLNGNGVTFKAKVVTSSEVLVMEDQGLIKPVKIQPLEGRDDRKSELVIIDNHLRSAAVFAEMLVPGLDDLIAQVELGFRQDKRGEPPTVYAVLDIERAGKAPVASMSVGYLKMAVEDLRLRMSWKLKTRKWDLSAEVDGSISLLPGLFSPGGMDALKKQDAVVFRRLNLLDFNKSRGEVALRLDPNRSVTFGCLDGMFEVELKDIQVTWGKDFIFSCQKAEFRFRQVGPVDVDIEIGAVKLLFLGGSRVKMSASRLGITAKIGDSVMIMGEAQWVDEEGKRFFAVAGALRIESLPEFKALLKLGVETKQNGQVVPSFVFYGSMDYEATLFEGVVVKNIGAGVGINNRLTGISIQPNAEEMLQNIDSIRPDRIEGWTFVTRDGLFVSIVGSVILASNPGGNDVDNAYVASLILSVDSDFNIVAAGKLWFSSTVNFVRQGDNWNRPCLVGALALVPRHFYLSAALESRPNPAIEKNEQLRKLLDKGHIKLSFLLSSGAVDYYLEDLSYSDEFLGIPMTYQGSYRFAIFRDTALLRASLNISGSYSNELRAGPGGFSFSGQLNMHAEYGGLISTGGLMAYAMVQASVKFSVSAWIEVGFKSFLGSYTKTFHLGTTDFNLDLEGEVAFNTNGEFGFHIAVKFSRSICGYRLSIAPTISIRKNVIDDVRARVAEFEQRLEAYKRELFGGGQMDAVGPLFMLTTAGTEPIPPEQWLHYKSSPVDNNIYHVVLPSPDGEWWLTPRYEEDITPPSARTEKSYSFLGQVTKIEVLLDGKVVKELLMPWESTWWEQLPQEEYKHHPNPLDQIKAVMLETALEQKSKESAASVPLRRCSDYRVLTDPRVESTAREYWTLDDQFRLPSYALPANFRSLDELLADGLPVKATGSDYDRLVEYLYYRTRAVRIGLHDPSAGDETETLHDNRAAVTAMILETVRNAGRGEDPFFLPIPVNPPATEKCLGLVFDLPEATDVTNLSFKVYREGDPEHPVITAIKPPPEIGAILDRIRPLPIRQQFLADKDKTDSPKARRSGRVLVKLPIKLDADLLQNYLPSLGHFQIWRQLPGEGQKVKIADDVHLVLTYLDDGDLKQDKVVLVGPYLYVDEFEVEDNRFRLSDLTSGGREILYWIRPIPPGVVATLEAPDEEQLLPWPGVRLHIPQPDVFPTDLAMLIPVHSLKMDPPDKMGLPEDPDEKWGQFQLFTCTGQNPALPVVPDSPDAKDSILRPLKPDQFELWVQEFPLSQSGFYVGAEKAAMDISGPGRSTDPRRLKPERLLQSTDGKHPVPVEVIPLESGVPSGTYKIKDSRRFRLGFGYRFFVRSRPSAKEALVNPLGVFLTRALPGTKIVTEEGSRKVVWDGPPKNRAISHVEWVNSAAFQQVENPLVVDNTRFAAIASYSPLEWEPRFAESRVAVSWDASNRQDGGVEVLIEDTDDSSVQYRVLCEVSESSVFQQSVADFLSGSLWKLTPAEQRSRPGEHPPNIELLQDEPGLADLLVLVNETTNPLLVELARRANELHEEISKDSGDPPDPYRPVWDHWINYVVAAKNWTTAVFRYSRSPMNLHDEAFRVMREKMLILQKLVILGHVVRMGQTDGIEKITLEYLRSLQTELDNHLEKVAKADINSVPYAPDPVKKREALAKVADIKLAKRCAAIVRTRLACAEEIIASGDDKLPSFDAGAVGLDKYLPRAIALMRIRQERNGYQDVGPDAFPLTDWFLKSRFAVPSDDNMASRDRSAPSLLMRAVEALQQLAVFKGDDARKEKAAGLVRQAAGLTLALNHLERTLNQRTFTLLKRSHSQVAVGVNEKGERVPQEVHIRAFMPDDVRSSTSVGQGFDEADSSRERSVVTYFNLLERMGFALDVAVADDVQQVISQKDLLDTLNKADLKSALEAMDAPGKPWEKHYLFVLAGREHDSEHRGHVPDPEGPHNQEAYTYTGFSFVKLAVIPASFLQPTLQEPQPHSPSVEKLGKWYSLRKVKLTDSKAEATPEDEPNLAYLKRIQQVAEYTKHAEPGVIMRIRLEQMGLRWITVPSDGGMAHMSKVIPDLKGHRYRVGLRRVSRYEPLIRWADGDYRSFTLPRAAYTEVHVQPTIADEKSLDAPATLPVSIYPHPSKAQFSFILPAAGIRSMLNGISAVRTGYKGYELTFGYLMLDRGEAVPTRLDQILTHIVEVTDKKIPDPEPQVEPVDLDERFKVHLFRNERIFTLTDLPFFYKYGLTPRSQYRARVVRRSTRDYNNLYTERLPGYLAVRHAKVVSRQTVALVTEYVVKVFLSRNHELLSPAEVLASPAPLDLKVPDHPANGPRTLIKSIAAPAMPDVAMAFHLNYQTTPAQKGSLYILMAELILPWHESYQLEDNTKTPLPWFRSTHADVQPQKGQERPPIRYGLSELTGEPAYEVELNFSVRKRNENDELFNKPAQRILQASRNGNFSQPLSIEKADTEPTA